MENKTILIFCNERRESCFYGEPLFKGYFVPENK